MKFLHQTAILSTSSRTVCVAARQYGFDRDGEKLTVFERASGSFFKLFCNRHVGGSIAIVENWRMLPRLLVFGRDFCFRLAPCNILLFKHDSERRLLCWMMRETKDESFLVWTVVDLESIGSRVLSLIEIQQYVGDSHIRVCAPGSQCRHSQLCVWKLSSCCETISSHETSSSSWDMALWSWIKTLSKYMCQMSYLSLTNLHATPEFCIVHTVYHFKQSWRGTSYKIKERFDDVHARIRY